MCESSSWTWPISPGQEPGSALDDPGGEFVGTLPPPRRNPRYTPEAVEQTAAEQREIARLFVPKFPVPPGGTSREEKEAWGSWVWFVRKFAEKEGVRKVDRPVEVVATVRMWEGTTRRPPADATLDRWHIGVRDALRRSLVPGEFLRGLWVDYEALPDDTPLDDRPRKEGTEFVILEGQS